ncbi:MAG: hypothetical protein H7336_04025 [Bacteriovorax sp.]|nr:hypothetical protein [Bacteriovorax sp.]
MTQIKKNLTDKNKSAEFDTEIEYKDLSRPNSKASEPAPTSSKPSAINKEKVNHAGAVKKKV